MHGVTRAILASTIASTLAWPASAMDDRLIAGLGKLEANTRLEQVCDLEAMRRLAQDKKIAADRAKSDITASPQHRGFTLIAGGAAFRAGGKWFGLSFVCTTSADRVHVTSFTYKVGARIPEAKWPSLGLWK